MSADRQAAFAKWWNDEGSAMRPLASEDTEEFAKRITAIAWSNGAFVERESCSELAKSFSHNNSDLHDAIRARGQA